MAEYNSKQAQGAVPQAYYYDKQLRTYILQFMAIFTGFQVKIGKRDTGETTTEQTCDGPVEVPVIRDDTLINVPIHYGHQDRVVAAIKTENNQNKPLRLPIMSAYMRGLDFLPSYNAGIGYERRQAYVPTGGLVPEDIRVVHQRRSFPFQLEMELGIYASNTNQHFQLLEQILMVFDPTLQIQTSDGLFDMGKITTVELASIGLDTNYPIGVDKRIIQSTLGFKMPIYLQSPADVRRDFVEKIFMRVGAVSTATQDNFDIIMQLDNEGNTSPVVAVDIPNKIWTISANFVTYLKPGNTIQIFDNIGTGDGIYTVISTRPSGYNTEIIVAESIPSGATPNGNCKLPNNYELIIDAGDLSIQ